MPPPKADCIPTLLVLATVAAVEAMAVPSAVTAATVALVVVVAPAVTVAVMAITCACVTAGNLPLSRGTNLLPVEGANLDGEP